MPIDLSGADSPEIRELTLADVDSLRLGWWSRFDDAEVQAVLRVAPGISTWIEELHEYALVGPWRHRDEIVHVIELVSIRHPTALILTSIQKAIQAGVHLFLAVEMTERRRSAFYEEVGLTVLEEVLSYELIQPRLTRTEFDDVAKVGNTTPDVLRLLLQLDNDAFPWLWQNSGAEFREYLGQPGVEINVLTNSSLQVGYVGITNYHGWGHIDRVAVRSDHQGNGFGRRLTEFAINRLAALGSTRIGLSTQRRNVRSQTLYESLGFQRQPGSDYLIYGRPLSDTDSLDQLVMGRRE